MKRRSIQSKKQGDERKSDRKPSGANPSGCGMKEGTMHTSIRCPQCGENLDDCDECRALNAQRDARFRRTQYRGRYVDFPTEAEIQRSKRLMEELFGFSEDGAA